MRASTKNECLSTTNTDEPGITYDAVEIAYAGYCYGDSTSGQVEKTLPFALTAYPRHAIARLIQSWSDFHPHNQCE